MLGSSNSKVFMANRRAKRRLLAEARTDSWRNNCWAVRRAEVVVNLVPRLLAVLRAWLEIALHKAVLIRLVRVLPLRRCLPPHAVNAAKQRANRHELEDKRVAPAIMPQAPVPETRVGRLLHHGVRVAILAK